MRVLLLAGAATLAGCATMPVVSPLPTAQVVALTTDQLREPQIKLRVSETCAKSDLVDPIIRRGDADAAPQVAVPGGAIGAPGRAKGQPRLLRVL